MKGDMTMKLNQYYKGHRKVALAAAVSSLAIMAVSPAYAQDDENDKKELEEIIVTGRFQQSVIDRLPVSPEELPFTINTLGREALDAMNYARPIDAIANLPNISIFSDLFNGGTPLMLTRGYFAPLLVDSRLENAFRTVGAQDDSFVQSYEVLKGPAGVSIGNVEGGGIFNTVTKSPELEPFVGIELRTDQFGTIAAEFDINTGPVAGNDDITFRISGAYRDWQYDAKETKRQTFAIRPVVEMVLSDSTSAKFSASYVTHDLLPNKGFPRFQDGTVPTQIGTDTFVGLANGNAKSENTYFAGEVVHEFLDNLKLTVRGSHQNTDFDYQNTTGLYFYRSGIPLDFPYVYSYSYAGDTDEQNTYIDAQLATSFEFNDRTQDIIVGGTYNKNKFYRAGLYPENFYDHYIGPVSLDDLDIPRYGVDNFDNPSFVDIANDDETELKSVYFEAALRPIEGLTIIGGLRYDEVESYFERGQVNALEAATTFRLGATYEVIEGLGVYISYAESFTPQRGELLDPGTGAGSGMQIGAQSTGGWEMGVKGSLFDDSFNFSAAYFNTTRNNIAGRSALSLPTEDYVVAIFQKAKGFEFSGDWSPVEGFNLNVQYGYIDIDIVDIPNVDSDDYRYSIPKHTFTLFATYKFQSGSLEGLTIGGGPRYVGKKPSQIENFFFDSITLVDAFVSYPVHKNVTATLNAHNLMNKYYFESSGTFFGRMTGSHVLGAPRTISLTLRARF